MLNKCPRGDERKKEAEILFEKTKKKCHKTSPKLKKIIQNENVTGEVISTKKATAILKYSQANIGNSWQVSKPVNNLLWLSVLPSGLWVLPTQSSILQHKRQ